MELHRLNVFIHNVTENSAECANDLRVAAYVPN